MSQRCLSLLLLVLFCAGCANLSEQSAPLDSAERVELESTPFFPQERFQCGPAALMTLLTASGVQTSLERVSQRTYLPEKKGSLQTELLAASRSFDRIPYVIDGTLGSIHAELLAGRPVLVLQNLGVSWFPRWHYAVVVGIDPKNEDVVLRSGTDERRITAQKTFLRTWARSDYWALVTLRPGELPADPDVDRYFQAVAAVEDTGRYATAQRAWRAALSRWPDAPQAMFGLAHSTFELGDYALAERTYRRLIEAHPRMHAARNNLAYVLAAQGRHAEAIAELESTLAAIPNDDRWRLLYESSLAEIQAQR